MDFPRAIIEVSGVAVKWTDIISLRVENTLYMAADSFEITLDNSNLLSNWFRKEQEVKLYIGYVKDPTNWGKKDLTHMFTGKIDGVKPSFGNPNTVQLIGRDYSARMIDTQSTIAFKHQKSGQIAKYFANKYNLKFIGQPGDTDISKEMITDKKEWDILQALADREGFVCYVTKNKELYFGPRKQSDEKSIFTFSRISGKVNCSIDYDDSSLDVITKVTVKHWHKKKLIQASAENKLLTKVVGQVKERVVYDPKAKTIALASSIAKKRLTEWSRNVVTASAHSYLIPILAAEKKVLTEGTGRFDGTYYIEHVTHDFSKAGATTEVQITNIRSDNAEQYRDDLYETKSK
jgi:hypothetical protein